MFEQITKIVSTNKVISYEIISIILNSKNNLTLLKITVVLSLINDSLTELQ